MTSGCAPEDFSPAPATPAIALVQRGSCTFSTKAENAQNAGYDGVIIFNEGQPGRTDVIAGTLGGPGITIPTVGLTFEAGAELVNLVRGGSTVTLRLKTDTRTEIQATENVIADSPEGDPNNVVVVGAHLDSVDAGPGINDNGSGTAAILTIAKQIRALNINLANKLRFAFWGAEESGLLGSEYYVANLSETERENILLNLNFDMLGSPNYVRFVYDGDGSDTESAGPEGSAVIERVFLDYFASQGLATAPTAFDGRSDYGPFIAEGVDIPAGGLFSGAEGIKTPEQAATYGGTAGVAYDACYHEECDTRNNVSLRALEELGDGVAHAVYYFATTSDPFNYAGLGVRVSQAQARVASLAAVNTRERVMMYKGPRLSR